MGRIKNKLHPFDVLFGRGMGVARHTGNAYFRQLVDAMRSEYVRSPKRVKGEISRSVVEAVHDRGGQFVQRVATSGTTMVVYETVDEEHAITKTSQALRELRNNATIRKTNIVDVLQEASLLTSTATVTPLSTRKRKNPPRRDIDSAKARQETSKKSPPEAFPGHTCRSRALKTPSRRFGKSSKSLPVKKRMLRSSSHATQNNDKKVSEHSSPYVTFAGSTSGGLAVRISYPMLDKTLEESKSAAKKTSKRITKPKNHRWSNEKLQADQQPSTLRMPALVFREHGNCCPEEEMYPPSSNILGGIPFMGPYSWVHEQGTPDSSFASLFSPERPSTAMIPAIMNDVHVTPPAAASMPKSGVVRNPPVPNSSTFIRRPSSSMMASMSSGVGTPDTTGWHFGASEHTPSPFQGGVPGQPSPAATLNWSCMCTPGRQSCQCRYQYTSLDNHTTEKPQNGPLVVTQLPQPTIPSWSPIQYALPSMPFENKNVEVDFDQTTNNGKGVSRAATITTVDDGLHSKVPHPSLVPLRSPSVSEPTLSDVQNDAGLFSLLEAIDTAKTLDFETSANLSPVETTEEKKRPTQAAQIKGKLPIAKPFPRRISDATSNRNKASEEGPNEPQMDHSMLVVGSCPANRRVSI